MLVYYKIANKHSEIFSKQGREGNQRRLSKRNIGGVPLPFLYFE